MISGAALRDFYIDQWRAIPALVACLKDQDEGWIRKHSGIAKISKSLQREVLEMPEGAVFVAYQGCKPGRSRYGEVTVHEIAAFIRAGSADDDDSIPFCHLMIDTVPLGQELTVRELTPHIDADPMNMPYFERVSAAELTVDIWKLSFTVPENFA